MPVCTQGYFVPGFNVSDFDPAGRPWWSERFVPCDFAGWCNATNGFDCSQPTRSYEAISVGWGPSLRQETGWSENPDRCMMIELGEEVVSPFSYLQADNGSTTFARYSPIHPYEWTADPRNPWSAYNDASPGRTGPFVWLEDRQVALVEFHNVTEGRYVCANGGNCTLPGVCECAAGWSGFDCRTPICSQVRPPRSCFCFVSFMRRSRCSRDWCNSGDVLSKKKRRQNTCTIVMGYYDPDQEQFVSGNGDSDDLVVFEPFFDADLTPGYRLTWPYSNPSYTTEWERFVNQSHLAKAIVEEGGLRYLGPSEWSTNGAERTLTYQGGYYCSVRARTEFENEGFVMDGPDFWSRYMDTKVEEDGETYTFWEDMLWPPLHSKSARSELIVDDGNFYVYTDVGHKRDGVWTVTGEPWQKGVCIVQFNRSCSEGKTEAIDLESVANGEDGVGVLVQDTDLSYRLRVAYNQWKEEGSGWWEEDGGQCVDQVIRGCFNNGTCVAPDVCDCAEGWTGYDCSVPECPIPCQHQGNCTLPGVCTCAPGWTGDYCEEAI
ncbi:unnamed protein product, partial [Scytosiphon promiscuus]